MLKKRFSSSKVTVRSGAARETSRAASRRSSVNGRAARTNGRISSRRIGVVSRRNGVTAAFVSSSLRIGGRSDSSDERSTGAKSRTSLSALSEARRAPGRRATAVAMDQLLERLAPLGRGARDARQVAVQGLEAAEHLAQVGAPAAQALAGVR